MYFDYHVKRKRRKHGYSSANRRYHSRDHYSHHGSHSRRRHRRRSAGKRVLIALSSIFLILVLAAGAAGGAFFYLKNTGKESLLQAANTAAPQMDGEEENGIVSRDGKKYRYNQEMVNILCMGIDRSEERQREDVAVGEFGQADTIFLLSLNLKNDTMNLLGISRDTMTEVRTYDRQGNYVGESKNHLGVAYAFGDGGKLSGELMTDAVSNLLYSLPIHGYVAVNMDAIEKLNDSVGGVPVTVQEDMLLNGRLYEKGTTVMLNGLEAMSFIRNRDMEAEGSNNLRMEHQKQYVLSYIRQAKSALLKKPMLAADLYQNLTSEMVTSIDLDEAVYLASLLPKISFQEEDIQSLSGTIKQGSKYEEFYVDEEALLDTIFDIFYMEVDQTKSVQEKGM